MAHIFGITFIASDRVFGVENWGGRSPNLTSAPIQAPLLGAISSAPVCVGGIVDADFRVYVLANGTIFFYQDGNDLSSLTRTFDVGHATQWSLAHGGNTLYVGTGIYGSDPSEELLIALDDTTGNARWSKPLPGVPLFPASMVYGGAPSPRHLNA
ncbi:outer membrane protein assembly factor BamB [Paraburkholderia sp. Clong3]